MSSNQPSVKGTPNHIICFVALPFNDNETFAYKTVLLPALHSVFEQSPYYWQVVRADDTISAPTIAKNIADKMQLADVGLADISDLNANVMMELGYMYWRKPEFPLFILERNGTGRHLSDLDGVIRITYPNVIISDDPDAKNHAISDISRSLKQDVAKRQDIIKNLRLVKRDHYLSPLVTPSLFSISDSVANVYADICKTMEIFISFDARDLSQQLLINYDLHVNYTIIAAHQRLLRNLLIKL